MRENGTLRYKTLYNNSPIDDNGDPVGASAYWSAPIPCLVHTITDTHKAKYADGEYRAMSFEVLVERASAFQSNAIQLERKGENLGEFQIISQEELPTVGRIRIYV